MTRKKVRLVHSNRIGEWRHRRDQTLEQLAKRISQITDLGITFQQLSKIERGDVRLTTDVLTAIARALEVQTADLLPAVHRLSISLVAFSGFVQQRSAYRVASARQVMAVICPPGCDPALTEVVEIGDDTLSGIAPAGWLIYYHRLVDGIEAEALDQPAVCRLADGRCVIGILRPSPEAGRFHILPANGLPPILDVAVTAASRIRVMMAADLAHLDGD